MADYLHGAPASVFVPSGAVLDLVYVKKMSPARRDATRRKSTAPASCSCVESTPSSSRHCLANAVACMRASTMLTGDG